MSDKAATLWERALSDEDAVAAQARLEERNSDLDWDRAALREDDTSTESPLLADD
ncbi:MULTISPECIES: hypothetical protein [Halomarina]|uniref:Uncharacterized protein n=2 Tax=Halomarina TaxID=871740 RepID=A0A6B0GK18_9EURY|nr:MULTISPECIES: hypothetical protein [Halomarina]MWG33739.1 hypothetical protein [Halomarina oriensis]